jgi:pseudouridine synthase
MRLQRALARAGVTSRRRAEILIKDGSVRVNGTVATIGMSVDPDRDVITVGRKRVKPAEPTWIALHKPVGHVVTKRDPSGRPTVFELLPNVRALTYVGRLDVMTSGLLLLTTDGTAAHHLMHPRYEVPRTYWVLVHGRSSGDIRRGLERPIVIDRRAVRIDDVTVRERSGAVELVLVLKEGRYRIVRRLCTHLGLKVERLVRLSYGPVRLGNLRPGQWRHLTKRELKELQVLGVA